MANSTKAISALCELYRLRSHPELVDLRDRDCCTAIYYAAVQGHSESVTLLLDLGADPNVDASTEGAQSHLEAPQDTEELAEGSRQRHFNKIETSNPLCGATIQKHAHVVACLFRGHSNTGQNKAIIKELGPDRRTVENFLLLLLLGLFPPSQTTSCFTLATRCFFAAACSAPHSFCTWQH